MKCPQCKRDFPALKTKYLGAWQLAAKHGNPLVVECEECGFESAYDPHELKNETLSPIERLRKSIKSFDLK